MKRKSFILLAVLTFVTFASAELTHAASATWVTPATAGATGVSENIQPSVTIPAALNPATVFDGTNYSFILKTGTSCTGGSLVPSTATVFADTPIAGTTTVTLTPSSSLTSLATYRACINSGTSLTMRDTGGTAVSLTYRSFTVRDYVAPTVTAFTPTPDHITVGTGSPAITFTFSELMDTTTITSSTFTLNDGANDIPGTFSFSTLTSPSRTKVTFTPSSLPLATMTTFYATIKSTVADTSGNQMGADYPFDFSVDTTAPVVSSYSPFPGSNGVAYSKIATPSISIVFSEDMMVGTITTSNVYIRKFGTGTNLTATVSYDSATKTATLTPSGTGAPLLPNTVYTVTVKGPSGVRDYWGNYMAANFSWNFTEDYTSPTVASVTPVNGATNVSITTPITATFTEVTGMNDSTIGASTFTVSDGTNSILGAISYDPATKKATFAVPGGLAFGTTYTVTLTNVIKDLAGNSLASTPYTWSFTTQPVVNSNYSIIPPFITAPVTPNVLIILDNSNSMDEDMPGNAVGSPRCLDAGDPNSCSRSILARKALIDLVKTYAGKIRIGLMTYKLNSASKDYLHNAFYFSSYDPKSYCPNPPPECYSYCVNENPQTGVYTPSAEEAACSASCVAQNALFDVTYRDKILTTAGTGGSNGTAIGSDKRKNYCSILYPKTQSHTDGSGTTIYHGLAGTFYSGSNQGTRYLYSSGYNSTEYPGQTDNYTIYTTKTGTSDGNSGYGGSTGSGGFYPTDDDFALGFYDFGQRMYWDYSSRTWFANSSPGSGYLHVVAQENVSPGNTQLSALLAKFGTAGFENDETGYMACTNTSNPNQCAYIVNAGLTPTAGTLKSAQDYFNGVLSTSNGGPAAAPKTPIQYTCQQNFVVYVTDGLPSVSESGTTGSADTLMPGVLTRIDQLRCPASPTTENCKVVNGANKYDVKTYVLGTALSGDAKTSLDSMAVHGGTAQDGHAYYANNANELSNSLISIFESILTTVSSGSAASIVNNRGQSGANIITAIFYPRKDFFGGKDTASWIGDLQNYWYYFDPYLANSTIREDSTGAGILNLQDDNRIDIRFDETTHTTVADRFADNGKGVYTATVPPTVELDSLKALWRAGKLLYERDLSSNPRKIFTTVNGSTFVKSNGAFLETDTTDLVDVVKPYLDVSTTSEAARIIKYMRGIDDPTDATLRNRTVRYGGITPDAAKGIGVWKLGDIINSTPKIQSDKPLSGYHLDYSDLTYDDFITSSDYSNRGMVYVGANDGMLHAFRLGKIVPLYTGLNKAELTNPGSSPPALGSEVWAFMPKNVLPYLKYYLDPAYSHMFYVDNTALLIDASLHKHSTCSATDYWDCEKKTGYATGKILDLAKTSWRTILLGGMGYGGASRAADGGCNTITGTLPDTLLNCVKAPMNSTGYTEHGLSSFFALDVTTPDSPSLLWSFSNPSLGYTISEPAIVRINGKKGGAGADKDDPDPTKNGRWFAVFASGPTGPIETTTHQFYARSDQNMKVFVVDLKTGALAATFDSGVSNSFAGSLSTNAVDVDKDNKNSTSYYSTDVVYIGYVKPKEVSGKQQWVDGGVLRLVTKNDPNPANWALSTLIDGVGPVTASIDKLLDKKDKVSNGPVMWLYFGGGRYFFKNSTAGIDSAEDQMTLYGIKEPCYTSSKVMNSACTTSLTKSTLTNQSSDTPNVTLQSGYEDGWYINLDASDSTYKAERVITTPSAKTNGLLQFTTFKPTADICGYSGETLFWLINYATGAAPAQGTLQGKVVIQLSTGAIVVVDLSKAKAGGSIPTSRGGRQIDIGVGKPPSPAPPSDSLKKPVKKILQIQER